MPSRPSASNGSALTSGNVNRPYEDTKGVMLSSFDRCGGTLLGVYLLYFDNPLKLSYVMHMPRNGRVEPYLKI